jgi:hypothetical protein
MVGGVAFHESCDGNVGRRIPKGFCNKAQGCLQRATLGIAIPTSLSTSKRLCHVCVEIPELLRRANKQIQNLPNLPVHHSASRYHIVSSFAQS